jgi:hypothetical protein
MKISAFVPLVSILAFYDKPGTSPSRRRAFQERLTRQQPSTESTFRHPHPSLVAKSTAGLAVKTLLATPSRAA